MKQINRLSSIQLIMKLNKKSFKRMFVYGLFKIVWSVITIKLGCVLNVERVLKWYKMNASHLSVFFHVFNVIKKIIVFNVFKILVYQMVIVKMIFK